MFTEMEKQYLGNHMHYLKQHCNKKIKFCQTRNKKPNCGCGRNPCITYGNSHEVETGNRNVANVGNDENVGTGISFSCDKCTEIWMPWPFDNIKFCLRDVLDTLAEALLKAVLGLGSETTCVPVLEGIVQTIALANLEDGIGEAIEVVLNPVAISALCGYIFEELIPRYGDKYTDEAKNAVLDWLCKQF